MTYAKKLHIEIKSIIEIIYVKKLHIEIKSIIEIIYVKKLHISKHKKATRINR